MKHAKEQHNVTAAGKEKTNEKAPRKETSKKETPHASSEVISAAVEELDTPGSASH